MHHFNAFKTARYAIESRCASFAMREKRPRKKATSAARAGSFDVGFVMSKIFDRASLTTLLNKVSER